MVAVAALVRWVLALAHAGDAGLSDVRFNDVGFVRFNRDVRPILADRCFACHGPDASQREAELRLDTREGLFGLVGGSGDAIPGVVVPGALAKSELWRRVAEADPEERMPPVDHGKALPAEALATLRSWIEQGAQWEGHWSFEPVARPAVPAIDGRDRFVRNEVDAFVLAALREHALAPQIEADRTTLIRRLSFDLTGLPPTPAEVKRFVADAAPDAFERQVDALLASPHYGERMAMQWLDLVRYADSVGYHGDQEVSVSPFRDWVIGAWNENLPFDQFTIEQLAGDLLPSPTLQQRIASGYNRLGMMSAEGGVQPKEYLAKYAAERVRNLGGTWLGATLGCCECHDHKFDPFATRDFYSFEAFFADLRERGLYSGAEGDGNWGPKIAVPTAEQAARQAELERAIAKTQPGWTVLRPATAVSEAGAALTTQDDGSLLASGTNPATDVYRLTFDAVPDVVTAIRIEVLPDDSLPNRGPGRAGNGNFVLSELVARVGARDGAAAPALLAFAGATASYEQTGAAEGNPYGKWAVAAAIDGDAKGPTWGWAVMEQAGRANVAVFELAQPLVAPAAAPAAAGAVIRLELDLLQRLDNPQHTLGRFRIAVTSAPMALGSIERLAALERERAALDAAIVHTLVAESVEPRPIRVLARGNWMDETGELREPSVPAFLPQTAMPADRRPTRLDLARWLVHRDHPLTARVFVNRLWQQFFGAGLSRKLDDLGVQGDWPSHPELLDWLASRFVDSGFDVKALVRLLVHSASYRQSSRSDARRDELDPANRWLSRQGRFRLDAELVRDLALRASGLLVERVGGTSVRPYQPPGYWAYLNFPTREWQASSGEALWRRGLYTHWQRQYLHPSLMAFDAPSREECTAERGRSNTPLQALVLLNDPIYVEAARVFAERIVREGGDSFAARVRFAFARVLSRAPRAEEVAALERLFATQLQAYRADVAAARQVIAVGAAPVASDLGGGDGRVIELAAWTSVARALLNLHEAVTRN